MNLKNINVMLGYSLIKRRITDGPKKMLHSNLTLSEVKKQFKLWRKTRKSPKPMPRELWDAAAKLSEIYSFNQISKELCLNDTSFKERARQMQEVHTTSFVEVNFEQSPLVSKCIVKMEDSASVKMRICFKGKTNFDLLEPGKVFWRKWA